MTQARCPYCGTEIEGTLALPLMSLRKKRILDAVTKAGRAGIKSDDLLVRMYGDDEWPTPGGPIVLRVQINYLNKILAPHGKRIRGIKGLGYFLISTREQESDDGKAIEETNVR